MEKVKLSVEDQELRILEASLRCFSIRMMAVLGSPTGREIRAMIRPQWEIKVTFSFFE